MDGCKKYIILFVFISLLAVSCREEIIVPDNIPANINEPVQSRSDNTYSFSINAKGNTSKIRDFIFSKLRVNIFLSVSNYNSGTVEINLIDDNERVFYSHIIDDNTEGITSYSQGYLSKAIGINFKNFTGNLVVQISGE